MFCYLRYIPDSCSLNNIPDNKLPDGLILGTTLGAVHTPKYISINKNLYKDFSTKIKTRKMRKKSSFLKRLISTKVLLQITLRFRILCQILIYAIMPFGNLQFMNICTSGI